MKLKFLFVVLAILLLTGCAKPQPDNPENICDMFAQYPEWYDDAKRSQEKWGVPIPIQMAIIYQESSFVAKAKPKRKKLFGFIPWKRPSTAYGYCQALDGTWDHYEDHTGNSGQPHNFDDATDFIGWYAVQARKRAGISITDPYHLYLAYHEGAGGYSRQSYLAKPWLIRVAHKVSKRAETYRRQLASCESRFN